MFKNLLSLFHPEQFHGWGKTKRYFEGWYYKVVTADESKSFAFIQGIAMDKNGNSQAFIQIMDGNKRTAEYHKFDATFFKPTVGKYEIAIGENSFTDKEIKLDLPSIKGKLNFSSLVPWPNSWNSPGIMGPFAFVPFMECYHGILSMDHIIEGELTIQGEIIDFTNGRGYMEKDWGHSFPSAYFWLQTNHFSNSGISLKASVANIPWVGNSFVGCIAGLWFNNILYQFTTYNGSKLIKSFADHQKVELVMENKNFRLEIFAHRSETTKLASPISGLMDAHIEESMTSNIDVILFDKKKKVTLLKDTGRNAGLDIAGSIHEIFI